MRAIKPKYPKCEVVYYEYKEFETVKRLVKVTAVLQMVSTKRGVVVSAKLEALDEYNECHTTDEMTVQEIGKRKNLVSCYRVTELI